MKQQRFKADCFKGMAYFGGSYTTTRAHRVARPVSDRRPMHLVLRSSKAKGEYSFLKKENARYIEAQLARLSKKYGIKIMQVANVGNHLHLMIKLSNRFTFNAFIRALTGAISLRIMGLKKFVAAKAAARRDSSKTELKFWDFRPYTRIVFGKRGYFIAKDYIQINKLEGSGLHRGLARFLVRKQKYLGEWRSAGFELSMKAI